MKALTPYFERACAHAALACQPWVGQGDKEAADAAAVEAIGRNPGAVGPIRITMIIGLALIESLVIYALIIAFLLLP